MTDVGPILHAVEVDGRHRRVRGAMGLPQRIAQRRHAEDASTVDTNAVAVLNGAGMEHVQRIVAIVEAIETVDRIAATRRLRIARCGEHDGDRGAPVPFRLDAIERAVERMLDQDDEVGAKPRENRLRLLSRIREATLAVADFSKIEGQGDRT